VSINRQSFGTWGVSLSASDFACALAALGVLQDNWGPLFGQTAHDPDTIASRLKAIESETRGALRWTEYIRPAGLRGDHPEDFVRGWKKFVSERLGLLRIALAPHDLETTWVVEQLRRPSAGVQSAFVAKDKRSPNTRWHWPLRVGYLSDKASTAFVSDVTEISTRSEKWSEELFDFVELRGVVNRCDLLVVPHSLRAGLASVLNAPSVPQADCAILLGPVEANSRDTMRLMNSVDHELNTNAIALVPSWGFSCRVVPQVSAESFSR
jgi:hypothetical protein